MKQIDDDRRAEVRAEVCGILRKAGRHDVAERLADDTHTDADWRVMSRAVLAAARGDLLADVNTLLAPPWGES